MHTLRASLLILIVSAGAVGAQSPAPADGCTYDRCALRVEDRALVRGAYGERVVALGPFGSGPARVQWLGDSARAQARKYGVENERAQWLGGIGALLSVASIVIAQRDDRGWPYTSDDPLPVALVLGGSGLLLASVPFQLRAQRALSRAVWWHNRELPSSR